MFPNQFPPNYIQSPSSYRPVLDEPTAVKSIAVSDSGLVEEQQRILLKNILSLQVDINEVKPKEAHIFHPELTELAHALDDISRLGDTQATFSFGRDQYHFKIQQEEGNTLIYLQDSADKVLTTVRLDDHQKLSERVATINPKPPVKRQLWEAPPARVDQFLKGFWIK